jgi:hypothetical protein
MLAMPMPRSILLGARLVSLPNLFLLRDLRVLRGDIFFSYLQLPAAAVAA